MRYKVIFAYDGTNYFGYAKQPYKKTIQGEIEGVLQTIFQNDLTIYASGRTDKGVHALNQVIHFDIDKEIEEDRLITSLNKMLPDDIYIKSIELVDENFHARFSAKQKMYEYLINVGEYNPLRRNFEHFIKDVDINKMEEAAKLFIGKHSFKNFTSKEEDEDNFVREISAIEFIRERGYLRIRFLGNGFMKYQVRKMVGVLLEIGKGKVDENFIIKYLNQEDRDIVTYTAPSNGLYLKEVIY